MVKATSIPSVTGISDPNLAALLNAIKTNLDLLQSGQVQLPGIITQEQVDAAAKAAAESAITSNTTIAELIDTTPPRAIDNLTVTGGVLYNFLTWGTLPGNLDHIAIYRAGVNDRTAATKIDTSRINIYPDYLPAGVSTTFYYWIRGVSKAGIEGDWNLVNGNVSAAGTSASPLGIGDSQVSSISATKIVCLSLAALTANLGDVTAGTLKSGDLRFQINLIDKTITIGSSSADPLNNWHGGNYTVIANGVVNAYVWNGSTHVLAQSLQTIETGVANNNDVVTLTKYYATQPKISVAPNSLQTYSAANAAVDQTLQIAAVNIHEPTPGSGTWQFTATAQLVLANGTTTVSPNATTGPSASSPLQSATYVTPANTNNVAVTVDLTSFRGTGTAPNYYYRSVTYYVYACTDNVNFVLKASKTVSLGATLAAVTDTLSAAMGSAGTWYFYVTAAYSDAGGTFTSGTGGYNYAADVTVNLAADTALFSHSGVTGAWYADYTLPAFTPASGWEIYQVDHTCSYGKYLLSGGNHVDLYNNWSGANLFDVWVNGSSVGVNNVPSATDTITKTEATYTAAQTALSMSISTSGAGATVQSKIFAAGTKAVIKQRQLITNSTTANNTLKLNSYTNTIAGATVLANGTLNWTAIL